MLFWSLLFLSLFILYRISRKGLKGIRRGPDDALSAMPEERVFTTLPLPQGDITPKYDGHPHPPQAFAAFIIDYQNLTGHAAPLSCLLSLFRHYRQWHSQEEEMAAE